MRDSSGATLKQVGCEIYLLKPSLHDLADLAARRIRTERDQEEAAQDLVEQGRCEIVVLSLGPRGALLATVEGCERFAAIPVAVCGTVVPETAFLAATVLGLCREMPLRDAVRFGMAGGRCWAAGLSSADATMSSDSTQMPNSSGRLIQINPEKRQPHHIAPEGGQPRPSRLFLRSPGLPLRGFSLICGDDSAARDHYHMPYVAQRGAPITALRLSACSATIGDSTVATEQDMSQDIYAVRGHGATTLPTGGLLIEQPSYCKWSGPVAASAQLPPARSGSAHVD